MCIRDRANGVPVPADLDNPYSVDQNLWGRANECGVLENPWNQAPEELSLIHIYIDQVLATL